MKSEDNIRAEVCRLISNTLKTEKKELQDETELTELTEDSIQLFELITAFESYYGVEVKYDDLISITTVKDIVHYVSKNTQSP